MRARYEEEPEPDEEPDEDPGAPAQPVSAPVVGTGSPAEREFEYRTEGLTTAQLTDGKTLAGRLTAASADGWNLVDIVGAGDKHVLLLRKPKKVERENRPVGFAPPGR